MSRVQLPPLTLLHAALCALCPEPGRDGCVQAMVATAVMHSAEEAAQRIIPSAAPLTVDPVQEVRHTALAAVDVFVQILRDHNRTLDDSLIAAGTAATCMLLCQQHLYLHIHTHVHTCHLPAQLSYLLCTLQLEGI